MADSINGVQIPFLPIGGVEGLNARKPIDFSSERPFEKILEQELKELKFSKHAQQRLESRDINLGADDLQSLTNAVQKAKEKGAQESLILLRNIAFVVNIKNNTVVTAMEGEKLRDNVFTNIDSAVFVK